MHNLTHTNHRVVKLLGKKHTIIWQQHTVSISKQAELVFNCFAGFPLEGASFHTALFIWFNDKMSLLQQELHPPPKKNWAGHSKSRQKAKANLSKWGVLH